MTPRLTWSNREWGIVAGLIALTILVFGQVVSHEFLNYDDPQFVFFNEPVHQGDLHWALTSTSLTWLPLTWISYMIDYRLFGLHAGGYAIVNAILHALSACLLFAAMRRMTSATWPSAVVAALFAIHPAHVESVAWISERKDVLSTLFAMLALFFYARRKLWLTSFAMALSLMAKQTYVTLPFILLLLDYWPLGRLRRMSDLRALLVEKVSLFALTILGIFAALAGQSSLGSVTSTSHVPMTDRLANAFVAYARYLGKMFVPADLAVLYPLKAVPFAAALGGAALFVVITFAAIVLRRRAPYVLVGWLWFVGTLIPVIGLVQIGGQAMADRYTYFAYIGLSLALVWSVLELRIPRQALAWTAAVVVAVFAAMAWRQTSYWKNCDTLFTHTLEVTEENPIAEYSLGQYLQVSDPPRALLHLQRAIDLAAKFADQSDDPQYGWVKQSHVAASTALLMEARTAQGPERVAKLQESIVHAKRALEIDPHVAQAPANIALAEQALAAVNRTAPPPAAASYLDSGTQLSRDGKYEEAVAQFRKAVEVAPQSAEPHIYLALGLLQAKHPEEAAEQLVKAKSIDAKLANDMLTRALQMKPDPGNLDAFLAQFQK